MSNVVYQDLSIDLKKQIISNSQVNKNLKLGFFSEVYKIKIKGKEHSYRFHSTLDLTNKKVNTVIFNGKVIKHKPFIKNSHIYFFDEKLKATLKINKELFDDEVINMDLSHEQKELLSQGKDITLQVSHKKNALSISFLKKSFVADYSFFLGKGDLLIKESLKAKNSVKMIIS